jgi:hypothetical protein
VRIYTLVERTAAALAAAHAADGASAARRRLLDVASADLRRIQREQTPWGEGLAGLLAASVAAAEGRGDDVRAALEAAQARCASLSMAAHAAAARVRCGEWIGGAEGEALRDQGLEQLRALGAKAPLRMARMLAPPVLGW